MGRGECEVSVCGEGVNGGGEEEVTTKWGREWWGVSSECVCGEGVDGGGRSVR